MADVTISELNKGIPAGNALLPYSTGSNTLGVPVSAILQNAGNIGIGTNNPSQKLDVYGGGAFTFVEVGKSGQTGNRFAYVDLTGDDTYTDYGFRILRGNTGANTDTTLINRGSGLLIVAAGQATGETGQVVISTANTERMRIDSSGNVGIGTSSPARQLTVDSAANPEIGLYTSGIERVKLSTGGSALSQLVIDTAGQPRVVINSVGMGISTISPIERLTVSGNISASGDVKSTNTPKAWVNFNGTTGATVGTEFICTIRSDYNVDRVVRTSTGNFRVYFTTAMSNTNYTINTTANTLTSPTCFFIGPLDGGIATSYFDIRVINFNNSPANPVIISAVVYSS